MSVTLSNALTRYLTSTKRQVEGRAAEEINRFASAIGRDKNVEGILPPQVADYAQEVVSAGGDVHARLSPVKDFLAFLKKQYKLTHSLAPHVKIPRAAARAAATAKLDAPPPDREAIELTQEGRDALVSELEALKGKRGSIVQAIRSARANGDVSENSPLDAAREHQGQTEARIRSLEETLRLAVVVAPNGEERAGGIRVGVKVGLEDTISGKRLEYTLVSAAESDPLGGKLSADSPVGKAIVGLRKGDEATIQTPAGERRYRILSVDA